MGDKLTVQQRAFLWGLDAYPDEKIDELFMQTARELQTKGFLAFRAALAALKEKGLALPVKDK